MKGVRETLGRIIEHFHDCEYFAHVAFWIKPFESLYFSEDNLLNCQDNLLIIL